jgi:SAM-dependent methyltransferase
MKLNCLEYLACGTCNRKLELVSDSGDLEITIGVLLCHTCGKKFPIIDGIPRCSKVQPSLRKVADSFGFEWRQHYNGIIEQKTVFGRDKAQELQWFLDGLFIKAADIENRLVLDAGCGRGRLTSSIGTLKPKAVFGVDISDAVIPAFEESKGAKNVHIVQSDIFTLPFQTEIFDYIYSSGVIHHTGDARRAFARLVKLLRPGGKIFIWVYPKRFNPFRLVKDIFDLTGVSRIPHRRLLEVCRFFSLLSIIGLKAYQFFRNIPPFRPKTFWGSNSIRNRSYGEFVMTWFDALSPEYDSRHTEEEVVGWFKEENLAEIRTIDYKVGVCGIKR